MSHPTEKHGSERSKFFITAENRQSLNSKSGTSLTEMMHMNELCLFFLELNERLKTDVTIKRMRLNKGLAQRILEHESKQKELCSAMLSTSRIEQRQKST